MATFQRSEVSFRRQGSSGLVWRDTFFSGDLAHIKRQQEREAEPRELRHCQSDGSAGMVVDKGRHPNGGGRIIHRTRKVAPDVDPPSPKVSGCFCFGSGKSPSKKGKNKF